MPTAEVEAVAAYFRTVSAIHTSGVAVDETSYYPALVNLLNAVGDTLKPKVNCIFGLRDLGHGFPDGGLFTANQSREQKPARGAIEVKPASADLDQLAAGEQVRRYWSGYGQVLATNLRAFTILGAAPDRRPEPYRFETCELADSEAAFWRLASKPERAAAQVGVRLLEFLRRALLLRATLASPEDVAFFLASYAREALARIEAAPLADLAGLRDALESALGLRFEGEKGEHFFRSSLIQTLFYGMFSAWALWAEEHPTESSSHFNWRNAAWLLKIPVLRKLFHELADPGQLRSLRLSELLDWSAAALRNVRRGEFFARFRAGNAVQYFYEPFLEAFDPDLRRELGVWYTPPEIVEYMVARVDQALRTELDLELGLADPNVIVLDPCCGTGSFLIEILRSIARTLSSQGQGGLAAAEVRAAARDRVFGFEILPAPFVIAHLQIGMLLAREALAFEPDESAGVYLTNALTGWEPPQDKTHKIPWAELEHERASSGKVKRDATVLVIIGNPPYNAYAGVSPAEEQGLVDPYKQGLAAEWGIKKYNLDDLYVRFFRIAERRIAEMTGRGVVSFISNYSYVGDPSFVVMRGRFLREFDRIAIDNLNGDSRATGKLTPEGMPDPSVFSTDLNREGIRVGTAICLAVRRKRHGRNTPVAYRDFWGVNKRKNLLDSLQLSTPEYANSKPASDNRYSFRPMHVGADYLSWPRVTELCATPPLNGLMEKRGGALIDINPEALAERMRVYFDRKLSWEEYRAGHAALVDTRGRFAPKAARRRLLREEHFSSKRILRYAVRPFDTRWCYYTAVRPIWNEPRPALREQLWPGNRFLLTRPAGVAQPEGVPFSFVSILGDNDYLRGHAYYVPFELRDGIEPDPDSPRLLDDGGRVQTANLSALVRAHLQRLGYKRLDGSEIADFVWCHVLAIGYSPRYLSDNADGIRQDWPRVPLPNTRQAFEHSATLGAELAAWLDTEHAVKFSAEFRALAELRNVTGKPVRPADCSITAGWGRRGKEGVVMPGRGKLARHADSVDVYLNPQIYWANVPEAAWDFTIGGFQVLKKWLSYRESTILSRPLTMDELREFSDTARRLTAIVQMQPRLDDSYLDCADEIGITPNGG